MFDTKKLNAQIIIFCILCLNYTSFCQNKDTILPLQLSKIQGKWVTENDDGTYFYQSIIGNVTYFQSIKDSKKIDSGYYAFCDDCSGIGNSDYNMSRLKINNESGNYLMGDSLFCYEFSMANDELSYQLNWTNQLSRIIIYKRVNAMHPGAIRGIIKAEKAVMYALPNKEKPMKKYLVRYDEIEILERQGAFTKIKFYDKPDIIGWIITDDIWK